VIETSIIIPTHNWLCVKPCIDAIVKYTESYEIIFVVDERAQFTDKLWRYGKVVQAPQPFIFAERINIGIQNAEGKYICLLNSDTVPEPDWLRRAIRTEQLYGPGLIGLRCQKNGCSNPDAHGSGGVTETNYTINMYGMLFAKRTHEVIGPLDVDFIYYGGEDDDYCLRALRHGFKLIMSDGYVHHRVGGGFDSSTVQNLLPKTHELFRYKWGMTMPIPPAESWIDAERGPKTKPLVSVLMPTWNHENYICEAVKSVKNQDYANVQILIGYDGVPYKESEADTGLDKIIGYPKIGSCAVRNELFKEAKGEFIALMDSDDIMLPGRITEQMASMKPDIDIINTAYIEESKDGLRKSMTGNPINIHMLLGLETAAAGGTFMLRRYCLEKEPFDQAYHRAFDFEYVLRTYNKFKYAYLDNPTIVYRRHAGEHLSGNKESHQQHKKLMEEYKCRP